MPPVHPSGRGIAATIGDIDVASDEALLRAGIDRSLAAVAAELRAHTPAAALAGAWSEVLRHGVATAARLASGQADWTWFVSGSVARGEAVPGSDVETMVAIGDAVDDEGKAELLCRAAEVHALLERCGIRGDANGVLASRPRFCRRLSSWADGVERWTLDPRRGPWRGDDRPAGRLDRGVGQRGPGARRAAGADHDRGRTQLPGASGHAAGRHRRPGRLPVAVARVRHARRRRRPQARGDRSRGEDRALGGAVGGVGRAVDLRAARRRRSRERARTRRRFQPARLLRVAAAVPLADAGRCIPRRAAGRRRGVAVRRRRRRSGPCCAASRARWPGSAAS